MSSMFECSRSDVASNVGVLAAAGLVGLTGSAWPNIIGGLIAVIFLRSAWRLLREAGRHGVPQRHRLASYCNDMETSPW
jgi:Co/Zn/Cd efflux system component